MMNGDNSIKPLADQEAENKRAEIELARQSEKDQFEIAKITLKIQAEDRREERAHNAVLHLRMMYLAAYIFTVIAVIVGMSVVFDKTEIIIELTRIICYGSAGAAVGRYTAKTKSPQQDEDE